MNYKQVALIEAIALIAVVGVSAIMVLTSPTTTGIGQVRITGAGATFPAPLYQTWSNQFYSVSGVHVDYAGIGSGAGVQQLLQGKLDFGASDPPMSSADWNTAKTNYPPGVLHIPMTIGGVVVIYNVAGISEVLNFSGSVVAQIFQRNITYWDDSAIAALNPGATLPHQAITVCRRSDSSGTTKIFTSFCNDSYYPNWELGVSSTPSWPSGTQGASGNPGVANLVTNTQYSIGYVELQYALGAGIPYGNMLNPWTATSFITPSLSTLAKAASAVTLNLPRGNDSWTSVGVYFNLLQNSSKAEDAYPITAFSYMLVFQNLHDVPGMTSQKAEVLKWWLLWCITDGQSYSAGLSYVPLPANVVSINAATIATIYYA